MRGSSDHITRSSFSPARLLQMSLLGRDHVTSPWGSLAAPAEAGVHLPPQVSKADLPETVSHHTVRCHSSPSFSPPATLSLGGKRGVLSSVSSPLSCILVTVTGTARHFLPPPSGPQWFHAAVAMGGFCPSSWPVAAENRNQGNKNTKHPD